MPRWSSGMPWPVVRNLRRRNPVSTCGVATAGQVSLPTELMIPPQHDRIQSPCPLMPQVRLHCSSEPSAATHMGFHACRCSWPTASQRPTPPTTAPTLPACPRSSGPSSSRASRSRRLTSRLPAQHSTARAASCTTSCTPHPPLNRPNGPPAAFSVRLALSCMAMKAGDV